MVREPLRQSKADLSRAKDTFERIHEMVVLYSSPFLIDMSSANLLWKRLHSSAMPPVVVKTKGVKVPRSTSKILLAYKFQKRTRKKKVYDYGQYHNVSC